MGSRWGSDERFAKGDDYDAAWRALAAAGKSIHGEADFVCGFEPGSVLDAGCGTGRVAIELAARGIDVVGVDLDPAMIGHARVKAPDLRWIEDDLATVDVGRQFDVVVMAGNVMIFVAPQTEVAVVANLARHVAPGGHLIAGFQLGRSFGVVAYDAAAADAGLERVDRFSTWDGAEWTDDAGYAVSVHRAPVAH
ncbi:MAG TPA: class I SAM-dependent methyltransferase [Ilumatobacteraceae bacterium]|nr:class I SAM-dependent methyltransferase [Ilumatobacteraceae bacterium]